MRPMIPPPSVLLPLFISVCPSSPDQEILEGVPSTWHRAQYIVGACSE